MIEFIHPTPFNDEINGRSRELKGSEKVDGEDCYIIHVVYAAEQAPQAIWSFSKKDFLPRRRIDIYALPDGQEGRGTKTITNLVVDPKVDEEVFKLKLPEGYTKTDDFAPNLLPRPTG
jgi:outer membrane lipoprotein-sorting protein